jgi:hypothetical protein
MGVGQLAGIWGSLMSKALLIKLPQIPARWSKPPNTLFTLDHLIVTIFYGLF